jgi:hypothetical protein
MATKKKSATKTRPAKTSKPPKTDPTPAAPPARVGDPKKLSALAAAARVLAEAGQPMTCPELIAAMGEKGYWTSPAGKTPAATLYAALRREIVAKGPSARFKKTGPGRFALA